VAAQCSIYATSGDEPNVPNVRIALHSGTVLVHDGVYSGIPVDHAAHLLAVAHGGQILLSAATWELVCDQLPPNVEIRDLGEYRLSGLTHSEHIFQLVVSDLLADFPPLTTLDRYPNNLPAQSTPLIGRTREVAALRDLILREDVRLVTLTGPGGIGKTRLAVHVAAELIDHFSSGIFYITLATISEPTLVITAIAQTLDVREATDETLFFSLKAYLRDKRMLLLLDNFEQVLAAAPMLAELLEAAPWLKIIVTSRVTLHLSGEHTFAVPPLEVPNLRQLPVLTLLSEYKAVRLFIERAQAVKADFAVTNESAPAVAEICHRLDGLPLAIELAAARSKLLIPQALLARLSSRLKLLTSGARDRPARQQTLRNTIAWSYDLLEPEEQTLFARLAVFVGGWTLEAAEAVCNANEDLPIDILDGLQSLLDKSMLQPAEAAGVESGFVMPETLREYALEQLEVSGEAETLRRQHAVLCSVGGSSGAGLVRARPGHLARSLGAGARQLPSSAWMVA
jgi:predicted ATPase